MRLRQTNESNWHETPCISTVDLSCTHVADLPADALFCSECPYESVRVYTSEKGRQAHRARAHGHRAMATDFVSDERCPACGKVFGSRLLATEHLQCRAQRCRRKMLGGLLPRLSAAVIATSDDDDRTVGLAKCTKSRFPTDRSACSSHWHSVSFVLSTDLRHLSSSANIFAVRALWLREHLQHVMYPS